MIIINVHSDPRTIIKNNKYYEIRVGTRWATPPNIYACVYQILAHRHHHHIIITQAKKTIKWKRKKLKDIYLYIQHLLLERICPFQITFYSSSNLLLLRISRKER